MSAKYLLWCGYFLRRIEEEIPKESVAARKSPKMSAKNLECADKGSNAGLITGCCRTEQHAIRDAKNGRLGCKICNVYIFQ